MAVTTSNDFVAKEKVALLVELINKEVFEILEEPPPEDVVSELAFWRAVYKLHVQLPSLKARDMALKSAAIKNARIKEATQHIKKAIELCSQKGMKTTQLNIESELSTWNDDRIFSDEKNLAKHAVVKSSTIKTYLSKSRNSTKLEDC
jgi:hypothetical protein